MAERESEVTIKLCVNCFLCKTRKGMIYCKKGCFTEKASQNKSVIHTPMDFDCEFYED